MPGPDTLDLAGLLDRLGHQLVALCWKPRGADNQFHTLITTPADAATHLTGLQTCDVWYSVNQPAGPPGQRPRGGAQDVTHLRALWADLDIKTGAFTDEPTAWACIDDLSVILGDHPVAVVQSGHGLQPVWAIDPDDTPLDTSDQRARAVAVLNRWRRLVETVAARRGAQVDAVFDLPRILRAPGTINWKSTPVPTSCEPRPGAPITLDQIEDALDEYGVTALDSDPLLDQPVDTSTWTWADDPCPYARDMITGWSSDTPSARHPWLLAQATRLAVAHRHGCLTPADHQRAIDTLTSRMQDLCAAGGNARSLTGAEVRSALAWGESRAALLGDGQIARELGGHDHTVKLTVIEGGDAIAATFGTATAAAPAGATATAAHLAPAGQPLRTTLTDDGNARRFVHHHGDHLRYSAARGWLDWDGTRWRLCEDDAPAIQAARDIAARLPEDTKEQARHKTRTLNRGGIESMVALARRDPIVRVAADQLDAHRMQLNTPDGTLDLVTGQLHEHRPADLHTKITGTGCDPAMSTPRWLQYLDDTFGGDTEMIGFLQRLLGYAATGVVRHHILPFLHGDGQNGKSVLTDILAGVLGEYAVVLPSNVLIAHRYSHDTELSKLPGARVAICSEVPTDGSFDEERVKALTGGDRISARELYKNPFEFTPSHTLILAGNHQPSVESGGRSFWRRTRLIPFAHTVPDEKKIDGLGQILVAEEGPGILAWIVAGAIAARTGLREPESVLAATRTWEAEEDAFGQFVADSLHLAQGSDMVKVKTTDLRKAYSSWCRDNGRSEMGSQAFSRELVKRTGARASRSHGIRYYLGVALIDTAASEEEDRRWGA
ncbi:phage/plasmid primase, P4 family [Gordonia sp. PP30]|uniref:DNA primase family protein n=1 Tax=Gordonia sp. PP30 TaxID=2935861 RepID=UPI001FFF52E1|nr:phage/plasmid primase, P4 family [Gordonia sp. PP30]UQE73855.1 phage/plasmid primase, P4 family [Gordonia sp. PP30]